jgi:acetoin utilization protein AcuB
VTKPVPQISKYMTTTPHTVSAEQTLAFAAKRMSEHQIRHLPVLDGGKLLGLLSDRDVKLAQSFEDVDVSKEPVESLMSQEVYTVAPTAALDEVARHMAEHKIGSTVVMDGDHVVGVFTTVDACRALADLLGTRLRK